MGLRLNQLEDFLDPSEQKQMIFDIQRRETPHLLRLLKETVKSRSYRIRNRLSIIRALPFDEILAVKNDAKNVLKNEGIRSIEPRFQLSMLPAS